MAGDKEAKKKTGWFQRKPKEPPRPPEETPQESQTLDLEPAPKPEENAGGAPISQTKPEPEPNPESEPKKKTGWFQRKPKEPPRPPEETPPEPAKIDLEPAPDLEESAVKIPAPQATPEPAAEPPKEKKGFLARLKQQLGKTKSGLVERVRQVITLSGKVDEETLEEIESILVQADVGIETTTKIIDRMRRDSQARRADSADGLLDIFKQTLLEIVSHHERAIHLAPGKPTVILVIGVNGVGKTTTIGKLASQYSSQGKRVMLVAGDTFRAAAVEQLDIWANRTGSTFVSQAMGGDPAAVCHDALSAPEARDHDIILIDTAGRLHTKSNLMEELKKINRVLGKLLPGAPHETLLILDATTGQNALSQARVFSEAVGVTGIIMTKLDGTAKGGILVALRDLFDIPVVKIGIGEAEADLRDFDPEAYIEALFAR